MQKLPLILGVFAALACSSQAQSLPNIIFFLLEGTSMHYANGPAMTKIRDRILSTNNGVNFEHMMATTPICCPSRMSFYSGMYMHNHGTVNNTVPGNCQAGDFYDEWVQGHSYAYHLHTDADYYTCHVGNYLIGPVKNPVISMDPAPGWDNWRTDPGHDYYDFTLNDNGVPEVHEQEYPEDYHTEVIEKHALACIQEYIDSGAQAAGRPFHLTVSTAASHMFKPYVAPQYQDAFADAECPRTPDFLYIEEPSEAKHWVVSGQDRGYNQTQIELLDHICRTKMRTLLSVDDTLTTIMSALDNNSMSDNSYTVLSGDHGYYVGAYGLTYSKLQPYDSSTRIPLWMSGPGIDGSDQRNLTYTALNIDIAPTFMAMAGLEADPIMDGINLLEFAQDPTKESIRDNVLIEYQGLHGWYWKMPGPVCADSYDSNVMLCMGHLNCICQDAKNNTYNCVRTITDETNIEYCEFQDDVGFLEFYDVAEDPYQLHNTAYTDPDSSAFEGYSSQIQALKSCQGTTCNTVNS